MQPSHPRELGVDKDAGPAQAHAFEERTNFDKRAAADIVVRCDRFVRREGGEGEERKGGIERGWEGGRTGGRKGRRGRRRCESEWEWKSECAYVTLCV